MQQSVCVCVRARARVRVYWLRCEKVKR